MDFLPVPDPAFVQRLHAFDPCLRLNFDPTHGVWAIWCQDPYTGAIDHVMNVVESDGSYRPLDDRVFIILTRNRYYAQHPDLLVDLFVDSVERGRKQAEAESADFAQQIAKDKSLEKQFNALVDKVRSVPLKEFLKPIYATDGNGKPIMIQKSDSVLGGEPICLYRPDTELLQKGVRHLKEEGKKYEAVQSHP